MSYLKQAAAAIFGAMLGSTNAMAVEEAEYSVVLKENSFEVRNYAPHVVAQTLVKGDFDQAGSQAFSRLFDYISGNNTSSQKIAMTAPVAQEGEKIDMTAPVGQQQMNGNWAVSFMMPASFSLASLPEPKDPDVTLRQVPERQMAAVRYSGFWSESAYKRNKTELDTWINKNGFRIVGEHIWARYNPPFMPWFLRRNEVLVPIVMPSDSPN
ncbi:SOUL heme-binding protein [Pseudomonas guineae]|uniref:SOUL heme-binding protein n=1 Tax=Pseudomonas guineae TaxID=425504 RepID=A0A1I3I6T5_9PSED|nr:heme-binding protein [Pseudomonas guineae]SFI43724.1 SOUL heme-binding protein [Pseudomonas guineae]|tara:strand:+ start:4399 stop:5031 length:633 start_codon:yes stop_codon:yes gene_type:complete